MVKFECNKCSYYSICTHRYIYADILDGFNKGLEESETPFECDMKCNDYTPSIPVGFAGPPSEFMKLINQIDKKIEEIKNEDGINN